MKTTEALLGDILLFYVEGSLRQPTWGLTLDQLTNHMERLKSFWGKKGKKFLEELEYIETNREYYISRFKELKLKESL